MSKFDGQTKVRKAPRKAPLKTTNKQTTTYEGGAGWVRGEKSQLFLLGVTNMVGEDRFYESAAERDNRFVKLVHAVTEKDPEWVASFVPFLRNEMFMRSASVVAACEYVAAGGPHGKDVIDSACVRADEPAEVIAYWTLTHGRNLPMAVKRGVAKAAQRLYNQYGALKYDGGSRGVRMGDVLELTHPAPKDARQNALFAYLLDRRHHSDIRANLAQLDTVRLAKELDALSGEDLLKRVLVEPSILDEAGYTWERLSGKTKMDAAAWSAIIPSMGYMALLRNLRNFDQAGVTDEVAQTVINKLSDPVEVAKSKQFPYRFYSAFKNVDSVRFLPAVEKGLDLSCQNIPELSGRSLILVDVSGSMMGGYGMGISNRSTVAPWEIGAVFGVAQWKRAANADLVAFASTHESVNLSKGTSVLKGVEKIYGMIGRLGGGTNTFQAIDRFYDGHDRVIVFTDMQSTSYVRSNDLVDKIPSFFNFDLGGYSKSNVQTSGSVFEVGGFSDSAFRLIGLLEDWKNASWPWE